MSDKSEVVLGNERVSEDARARYKKQIDSARLQGTVHAMKEPDPVGTVQKPKIPNFAQVRANDQAPDIEVGARPGGVAPRPPGSPAIRPETVQQLEGFNKAVEAQAQKKAEEALPERAVQDELNETRDLFEALMESPETEATRIMSSKKRRLDIESRCVPMKFEDLLTKNEVRQVVPIIPGKFEATFRSITPEENLFIKMLMAREKVSTDSYVAEKFSLYQLAFAVVAINGADLPSHLDQYGEPKEDLVATKVRNIQKKSGYIIADLHQNYIWFDLRVRKLFSTDELKNG